MIRNIISIFTISLFCISNLISQDFSPLYIQSWKNNKELKAKEFQLLSAIAAYNESKTNYHPKISLGGQYTLAEGGRNIQFPIGDLLNPAYQALNRLTNSADFQNVENSQIEFLPNNYYDAHLRIQQALFHPEIKINEKIKREEKEIKELEIKAFKRLLCKEVTQAYFQYQSALKYVQILDQAESVLTEAKRATTSMVKNGISLPTALIRIESELANLLAQQIDAKNKIINARKYLTFFVGEKEDSITQIEFTIPELPSGISSNSDKREELHQLNKSIAIHEQLVKLEKTFHTPKIGAQLDLGTQDYNFGFEPYALLGVNIELNIYDGNKNKYKKQQALLNLQNQQTQFYQIQDRINLQSEVSQNNLQAAIDQANTFYPRIESNTRAVKEVFIKYKEGTSTYLEFIDANTQKTQVELQYTLARYDAWIKWAELQYINASLIIE